MCRVIDGDELMTSPEVSRLLGVSARTVHRRVEAGELPPAQKLPGPNGAFLFRRQDVEKYIAQQRAPIVPAQRGPSDSADDSANADVDAEADMAGTRVGAA